MHWTWTLSTLLVMFIIYYYTNFYSINEDSEMQLECYKKFLSNFKKNILYSKSILTVPDKFTKYSHDNYKFKQTIIDNILKEIDNYERKLI
jgi:hypothetical protein